MLTNFTITTIMKKQLGLTLIELMVALAAVAILMSLAVPAFKQFSASNKQSARINKLTGAFAIARSEAVTRNARMVLRASDNTSWANGWTLEEATSGDDIKVGPGLPDSVTLSLVSGPTSITFNSDGTTSLTGDLIIQLCDSTRPDGDHGMSITLIPSGRYSVAKGVACPFVP